LEYGIKGVTMSDDGMHQSEPLKVLIDKCSSDFLNRYGVRPDWLAVAPGRVNLIGEHTDYNDGFVLPMAIERYVVIAARKATNSNLRRLRLASDAVQSTVDIPIDVRPTPSEPKWANYPRGVLAGFIDRGLVPPSIDALMVSNVPLGAGLSSSAAVEVAVATLLEMACDHDLEQHEKARLCRKAEHDFAGVPCGIMDQMISVLGDSGGAILIDCRAETARCVPLADTQVSILVTNTNIRHSLGTGEYGKRRAQCCDAARKLGLESLRDANLQMLDAHSGLTEIERRRARHVVTENERTLLAAESLMNGDMLRAGHLMYASHASLRDDYEVSCPELDILVDCAGNIGESRGVFGARMTGGGFGGCTVTLLRTDCVEEVMSHLATDYRERTGRVATGFVSRPARGAHQLRLSQNATSMET
jgi:galactokinase